MTQVNDLKRMGPDDITMLDTDGANVALVCWRAHIVRVEGQHICVLTPTKRVQW